jgi:hypothetical protein
MAAIDGKKDLDQRERLGVLWANIKRRYGGDKKPISLEPLIASDGVFVRITRAIVQPGCTIRRGERPGLQETP